MAIQHIALLLLALLASLASTFGTTIPAPKTAPGDFFYQTPENTDPESSSTRNLCRENGWLHYDSTPGEGRRRGQT